MTVRPTGSSGESCPKCREDYDNCACEENGHRWFKPWVHRAWRCCRFCGIVRRSDGRNKPCPGQVSVSLRTDGA